MRRRVFALVAALLLAGIGTFVLVGFVRGAADRATAGEELVTIYLVSSEISKGTPGEQVAGLVTTEQVPIKVRSPQAITDLASLDGLVAEVDLVAGEQLLAGRFVPPAEADLRREDLPDRRVEVPTGHLEVPVRFEAEQALGGIIDAGDTVAVIASFTAYSPAGTDIIQLDDGGLVAVPETADTEGGGEEIEATHIIIENALVVEVQADSTPSFRGGEEGESGGAVLTPSTSFTITFALEPIDVERLVFAAEYGSLWLAAQTPDDVGATSVVTMNDIFQN